MREQRFRVLCRDAAPAFAAANGSTSGVAKRRSTNNNNNNSNKIRSLSATKSNLHLCCIRLQPSGSSATNAAGAEIAGRRKQRGTWRAKRKEALTVSEESLAHGDGISPIGVAKCQGCFPTERRRLAGVGWWCGGAGGEEPKNGSLGWR